MRARNVVGVLLILLSAVAAAAAEPAPACPRAAADPGAIRPAPAAAEADVPAPQLEGCMIGIELTRSGPCVYGDTRGHRTLILFGDSHALQFFPALEVVAERNRWRLVVLTKRECPAAEVTVFNRLAGGSYGACDTWRREELRRLERRGGHPVVLLGGKTDYTALGDAGEELSGQADADAL
ncbi:MAG TPA: SGNH hydrolase domain-containing protein, partial [Solirubrobacterales bacterium]|nr:SGNH hydrolase domain-containing protein [Solirubrobacterales bacterium]